MAELEVPAPQFFERPMFQAVYRIGQGNTKTQNFLALNHEQVLHHLRCEGAEVHQIRIVPEMGLVTFLEGGKLR